MKSPKNRKIVINSKPGGFSVSRAALDFMRDLENDYALSEIAFGDDVDGHRGLKNIMGDCYILSGIPRDDKDLVLAVEKLGQLANGTWASLAIVEIPSDVKWTIEEHSGVEHVAEVHRKWYAKE
jgi:hypothetical protein